MSFELLRHSLILIIFRDYESGGLNLNAAHFAQLSVSQVVSCSDF